jgi:hypothetical protein
MSTLYNIKGIFAYFKFLEKNEDIISLLLCRLSNRKFKKEAQIKANLEVIAKQ